MTAPTPHRAIRFILLTVLIDSIGFGIVLPVLPGIVMKLAHVDLPAATRIGGWLGVAYAAVQFLSGPLVGNMGDRFGRRPVLLGAMAGFAIDYGLMGFAPTIGWLFAGRALAGFFGASFGPAGAALADVTAPEERARWFGMIGAAFGIGFVVGPAIGGLLGGAFGPRAPFHAAAVLATVNLAVGLLAFPETLAPANRRPFRWARANPVGAWRSLGKLHGVIPLLIVAFFFNIAAMIYPATWSFYAIAAFGWTPGIIGASLAMVGAIMALSQIFVVGRVVRRIGERNAAALGISAAMVGYFCYTMIHDGRLAFAVLLIQVVTSLVMPSLNGMMSRRVPADAQGELQGFGGSLGSVAAIIAPALYAPAIAYYTGPQAPFRFVGVGFAIAIVFAAVALAVLLATRRGDQMPPATPA